MNRTDFLACLRQALQGLPSAQIDDIVADYDAHFSEALAAQNRSHLWLPERRDVGQRRVARGDRTVASASAAHHHGERTSG